MTAKKKSATGLCPFERNTSLGSRLGGLGKAIYRDFCRDIPAIAENILNPDLDLQLERYDWSHAYRDQIGIPTRVNPVFQRKYPEYANAMNPSHAILTGRNQITAWRDAVH